MSDTKSRAALSLIVSALFVAGCGLRASRSPFPSEARPPSKLMPLYPQLLRAANIEGNVIVDVAIDSNGRFDAAHTKRLASSHDLFWLSVRKALESAWQPAAYDRRPIASVRRDTFTFILLQDSTKTCPRSTDRHHKVCAIDTPTLRRDLSSGAL